MAIWPSPMIYAGPTEVQFHAKSRRVGGAAFFTVGRDPAGMPYSSGPLEGEDLYHPDHGRYALMSSPGVGGMQFLGFEKVYYDKKDHTMRGKDASRKDDFISISGSKMRKLAALGAKPCPDAIPSDLLAAKCIPPGFMVDKVQHTVLLTPLSPTCPFTPSRTCPFTPAIHRPGSWPTRRGTPIRTFSCTPFTRAALGGGSGAATTTWTIKRRCAVARSVFV